MFLLPICGAASWKPYLGFNREVTQGLVLAQYAGRRCVLVSCVLPMGYLNSVSIAQHFHRNIVRWSAESMVPPITGEGEMRKDKGASSAESLYRVYLDNFDQVERCDRQTAELILGTPSAQVLQLRHDYITMRLPRHPKKSVERQYKAEIQGALFDGLLGFAMPKVSKVWQYALLAAELLKRGEGTLKELPPYSKLLDGRWQEVALRPGPSQGHRRLPDEAEKIEPSRLGGMAMQKRPTMQIRRGG